jgi:pimeloyl-ACP methyl ester carboxylesterase
MATVAFPGVTLELDDVGKGEPVLLLHGFPASRQLWAQVALPGFRVLAPDLAGYGESRAAPGLDIGMAAQARWMLQLLDRLGIGSASVVAHDVGSAAALILLALAPERVRALVVIDGVYKSEWAMSAVESIRNWDPAKAARLPPVLTRRLGKAVMTGYEGEEGGLRLIRAARDLRPAETADLRLERVPALVLWGERDAYLPIESVARPLAEQLGAPLRILPGGHFLPLDSPREVAEELLEFLTRSSPAADRSR